MEDLRFATPIMAFSPALPYPIAHKRTENGIPFVLEHDKCTAWLQLLTPGVKRVE